MILYQKRFVTIAEVFFDEPASPGSSRVDIIRYRECRNQVPGTVAYSYPTIEIDLRPEPDVILAQMRKRARKKIRDASATGGLRVESGADRVWLEEFASYFNRFAVVKKLPEANGERLRSMLDHGMLDFSRVMGLDSDEALAYHVHSLASSTARLLHSAALFHGDHRAEQVSDANAWLHWQDMLRFRGRGIEVYDMGGWHDGEDPELLRLNTFKESFGGRVAPRYYADCGLTLRGKLAVVARQVQGRLRGNR